MNISYFLDKNVQHESETDSFSSKVERYKQKLQERKKTREILNSCGLKQDWLKNKTGRSELENRVLKRLLLKGRPEITIKQVNESKLLTDLGAHMVGVCYQPQNVMNSGREMTNGEYQLSEHRMLFLSYNFIFLGPLFTAEATFRWNKGINPRLVEELFDRKKTVYSLQC